MKFKITAIKGDGIGPEIVDEAVKVLKHIGQKFSHDFHFSYSLMGGVAIDETGKSLPDNTVKACLAADSVLLGAVGGPKWEHLPGDMRPEAGLLKLRKEMGLYANLRPAKLFSSLKDACPLRDEISSKGIDMMVVRELTSGIYFGKRARTGDSAYDTESITASEVSRIAKVAFDLAKLRRKKVFSIDKANVLESSRLWREVVHKVADDYPKVFLQDLLVDNAAMQLIKDPTQFDVILANNLFGDILSDEAAMVTGSIGMLASASLGDTKCGLYEPIHGSAPAIAGSDVANPIATILSCAMMLRYSFDLEKESQAIEQAVQQVLSEGIHTRDIAGKTTKKIVGTKEMGLRIVEAIFEEK